MKPEERQWTICLACAALVICCAAIYGQTLWHGFVSYDDGLYVFENARVRAGLSWDNLAWAFTTRTANYVHPVTWLDHMLDCQIYGLRPSGHHMTSLLFHTANTVLLFLVLAGMTRRLWPSALAAALFAVHPLHVETVAWVAERKGLLGMFFWTAAIGAYAWHRRHPHPARYLAVMVLFLLALLSKPVAVTLPFVLLLLDYWPLDRVDRTRPLGGMVRGTIRLVVEKIPLFLLTALFCTTTFVMQAQGNNLAFGERIPFTARCANAVVVYVLYLVKTVWPSGLAVYYPHPLSRPAWQVAGAAAVLAAVTLLCLANARRRPWLVVGWLWYLGTLLPVMQLVQIGTFSHADRYTYIPLIGIFVMAAWTLDGARRTGPLPAALVTAASVLATAALAVAAFQQTGYWKDDLTLFSHDLAVAGDNPVAHNNLGAALLDRGKVEEAAEHYRIARQVAPQDGETLYNLGVVMSILHRPADAEACYREALRYKPGHAKARNNLAGLLAETGRTDEAMSEYQKTMETAPGFVDPRNNLANLLAVKGDLDGAAETYRAALEIDPSNVSVRLNLANICMHRGLRDEARAQLEQVLKVDPNNQLARGMLVQLGLATLPAILPR